MKGIILAISLISIFVNIPNNILSRPYENTIETISPKEIMRIDNFLKDNDELLNEGEKEKIKQIKNKIESFEAINQEEVDFLRECELNIIRKKLGEEKFNEYCKLINKREGTAEFTQPERFRLLELEKELR